MTAIDVAPRPFRARLRVTMVYLPSYEPDGEKLVPCVYERKPENSALLQISRNQPRG